jgi:hypothetical protein
MVGRFHLGTYIGGKYYVKSFVQGGHVNSTSSHQKRLMLRDTEKSTPLGSSYHTQVHITVVHMWESLGGKAYLQLPVAIK